MDEKTMRWLDGATGFPGVSYQTIPDTAPESQAQEAPLVFQRVDQMAHALDNLEKAAASLEKKLGPVMKPKIDKAKAEEVAPKGPMDARLSTILLRHIEAVDRVSGRLIDTLCALEV